MVRFLLPVQAIECLQMFTLSGETQIILYSIRIRVRIIVRIRIRIRFSFRFGIDVRFMVK